jgi:cell division protein FtsW
MVTAARWCLWFVVPLLCGFGLVMVTSTTTGEAAEAQRWGLVLRQAAALGIGLACVAVISGAGTAWLRRTWLVVLAAGVAVLLLAALPWCTRPIKGAWRWYDLGPIKLQPAELAKVVLVLVAAWYLTQAREKVRVHWYGALLPIIGFLVLAGLVLRTRDLGTVLILGVTLWAMLFFIGARWVYTTTLGVYCLPLAAYITIFQEGYRWQRLMAYSDPFKADGAAGYHLQQSAIAIGSGGIWGVGLGQGGSKSLFLPEKHTDFIYSVICEELGMVGGLAVALAFLLLIAAGLVIANATRDRHQRLLVIGATVTLGFQACWHMLVATGAVPTKGLTLPFVSYGGSSLVVSLILVGFIDAVARTCDRTSILVVDTTNRRLGAVPRRPSSRPPVAPSTDDLAEAA